MSKRRGLGNRGKKLSINTRQASVGFRKVKALSDIDVMWYLRAFLFIAGLLLVLNTDGQAANENDQPLTKSDEISTESQTANSENTTETEDAKDSKIKEFLKDTSDPNEDTTNSTESVPDGRGAKKEKEASVESSVEGAFMSSSTGDEGGYVEGSKNNLAEDLSASQIQISTGSNTGAAVTSIPIVVPPGRKGIQPNISLNYNSNRRNGWIGVGWGLDMGSIQRNTKRGVVYTSDDYVASGNGAVSELTPRGDWGLNYYGAQIEGSFSKYHKISDTQGWMVTTKDGTRYYYGSKLDGSSRQDHQDPDTGAYRVFKWCLDRVEDTNGNYMEIYYRKDQGEIYLDEIKYTGNTNGLPPANSIKFLPDSASRTDTPSMYTINSEVKTNERLGKIQVYGNGQLARSYVLSYKYSSSSRRSLLYLVDRLDSSEEQTLQIYLDQYTVADRLNPSNIGGIFTEGWITNSKPVYMADVDGDGDTDAVGFDSDGVKVSQVDCGSYSSPIQWVAGYGTSNGWTDNDSHPRFMGDFNGDGKADVVGFGSDGVYVSLSNGVDSFTPVTPGQPQIAGFGINHGLSGNKTHPRFLADINGDGKSDIVGFYPDGVYVSLAQGGTTFSVPARWVAAYGTNSGWIDSEKHPRYMADVNGDGKADVVGFGSDGVYASLSNGVNSFSSITTGQPWVADYGTNTSRVWKNMVGHPRHVADVNGDGKADIVGFFTDGVYVSLSTGLNSFVPPVPGQPWVAAYGEDDYFYQSTRYDQVFRRVADINGDGMADVIGVKGGIIYVSLSTGKFFKGKISWGNWHPWTPDSMPYYQFPVYIADIEGDGKQDLVTFDKYGILIYKAGYDPLDALKTVENYIGGKTTIKYKPSSVYANDYLPFIVSTVSSVEVEEDDDINTPKSITNYKYESGFFDVIDREFRGFGKVIKTSPNNTVTETEYYTDHQNNYYKGLPKEQTIKKSVSESTSNIYLRTIYTYDLDMPYADVDFPYLVRRDDYIFDGITTDKYATSLARHIASEYRYDDYGNITVKYFHGDERVTGDEKYEYTYYAPYNTNKWIMALPKVAFVTDGTGHLMAQKWFAYYPNTTNLHTVEAWNDNGPNPVTTYEEYDLYGNPKKIRDPRGNLTKISYDTTTNTYPWKIENAVGHITERTYNYRFGSILTEKDANQNQTTYEYDGFGRTKRVLKPAPYGITEYFYNNFGDPSIQHKREEAQDQAGALIHWKESYFDGLGRTTSEMSGGPGTSVIVVDTSYNNQGLVASRSYPYYYGETPDDITYWYDAVDRIEQTDFPDGTSTFIYYDRGRITYIDANGHKKVAEKDAYGRIVAIEEYTGNGMSNPYALYAETLYWYDALNNLEYVRDAQGNETYITYDSLSRKMSIYDPDMGLWEYGYDPNGNLISQADQMDRTILFEYDKLNRVMLKNYPTGTDITYVYDEASLTYSNKGRMTTVSDSSGTTKFYYDPAGQIKKSVKTLSFDSSVYTTQTQYDPLGRVKYVTYPDNTVVEYTYDDHGNIDRIISGASAYVDYNSYTALGKPLLITFNNGVTTQYEYYPRNNRLKKIYTSKGTTPFMNLEYFYDKVGNITLLTDHLDSNKTRSYKYDDLDRLVEAVSDKYGGKVIYQYDRIGNMTYNCRFGHYYYEDVNHVHAVTSVRRSDGTLAAEYRYDGNGNMIESKEYDETGVLLAGKTRTFTYDYDNMPTSIAKLGGATVSYYDSFGMRATKTVPVAGTTKYIGQIFECSGAECTKYIFSGMQRMAEIDGTGIHYYHTDHLGSSTVMTDSNGSREREVFYYPYGEMHPDYYTNDPKYLYTGKEYDAETGLYYYGARYYDPKLARFISADTIVPEPFYPQSFNRYAYAINNPIVLKDLDGHCYSGMPSGYTPSSPNPTPGASSSGGVTPGGNASANNGGQGPAWGYGYSINSDGTYPISPHAAFYAQMAGDPSPGRAWSSYYGGFWGAVSEGARYAYNEHIAPAMQSIGTILSTDLQAFYRGQFIGHLKVLGQDIKDIGAAISNGDIKGIVTKALDIVGHLAFPYYGNFTGYGWGPQNMDNQAFNHIDSTSRTHDIKFDHTAWVLGAYGRPSGYLPAGPIGLTYQGIGTIPFLIGGGLQKIGLLP